MAERNGPPTAPRPPPPPPPPPPRPQPVTTSTPISSPQLASRPNLPSAPTTEGYGTVYLGGSKQNSFGETYRRRPSTTTDASNAARPIHSSQSSYSTSRFQSTPTSQRIPHTSAAYPNHRNQNETPFETQSSSSQPHYSSLHYRQSPNYPQPHFHPSSSSVSEGSKALNRNEQESPIYLYQYNGTTALLLLPPLLLLFSLHSSPTPFIVLLYTILSLYALDLAGWKDVTAMGIWVAFLVVSMSLVGSRLFALDGSGMGTGIPLDGAGFWVIIVIVMMDTSLLFCLACWASLQFQWIHIDAPLFAISLERLLHSILPLASSSILSYQIINLLLTYDHSFHIGIDMASTIAPYLFASSLTINIALSASVLSSFHPSSSSDSHQRTDSTTINKKDGKDAPIHGIRHAISSFDGCMLTLILLFLPSFMHLVTFRRRIFSSNVNWFDISDAILILSTSFLLHYLLDYKGLLWWKRSLPFFLRDNIAAATTTTSKTKTKHLRGKSAIGTMIASFLASSSFQYRYLIPMTISFSYTVYGKDVQAPWVTSIYLSMAFLFGLISFWFYGSTNVTSGAPLFGDYHDDVFQTLLVLTAACLGMAFALPYAALPVISMGVLSLGLFCSTKMLRYMLLFSFAVSSVLYFMLYHRFHFIKRNVDIIPGLVSLTLFRFSILMSVEGFLFFIIVALVMRSPGGLLDSHLKAMDLTGLCFILSSIILVFIEASLLTDPVGTIVRDDNEITREEDKVYSPFLSLATGVILVVLSWWLKRNKAIKASSFMIATSCCIGKMTAVLIRFGSFRAHEDVGVAHTAFLMMALMTSALLIVIFAPYVYLEPVHARAFSSFRSKNNFGPSAKPVYHIPKATEKTVMVYCALVLPLSIMVSTPKVLTPFVDLLSGRGNGGYYRSSPLISEVFGYSASLWGVASLCMLNHFLPDGGAEFWRKASALMFLFGICTSLVAPNFSLSDHSEVTSNSIFASLSSLGSSFTEKESVGGWGLISSILALLLALTGPLDLRGTKTGGIVDDDINLLRLMAFSIMFGCGVAWFLTLQMMDKEESLLSVMIVLTSCMAMSFLGTTSTILGYCVEAKDFDEVQMIVKIWIGAFIIFFVVSGSICWMDDESLAFGEDGWLSTFFTICSLFILSFSMAARFRRGKSVATRAAGNLSCIIALLFMIVVIYGDYGIAGIGVSSNFKTVMGIPASIFFTFVASLTMLLLEGEPSGKIKRKISFSSTNERSVPSLGINLPTVVSNNRFALPFCAASFVFICISMYAIFLRGLGSAVHKSHVDVYASTFGVKGVDGISDVASMAKKNLAHSNAVVLAAKLAGSGLWTAPNMSGPFVHILGVLAVLPTWYLLSSYVFTGIKQSSSTFLLSVPINAFPLIFCKGIPCLRAAAVLGLFVGLYYTFSYRRMEWAGKMNI